MDLQCTLKLAKMGCVAVESGSFMQSSSPQSECSMNLLQLVITLVLFSQRSQRMRTVDSNTTR